ncbi:putative membrane protein YesL [Evansella vedderi]|uniref:Membrane protein YesL n=1 Tax=Evansella vedderi TaxID=38282 RepID=A0ABT9ZYR8_9BACI|nr:DUF624 domain-containing protein [Evansella vedderi]MDQ0255882.1 putative membrane protein YesL [Evansella vedderi]
MVRGIFQGLYSIGDFLLKILYLQLLWVIFTLLGFVILGISPATLSLFIVIRKWLREKQRQISFGKLYWQTYKEEFIKGNILGWGFGLIGYFIIVNILLLKYIDNYFKIVVLVLVIAVAFIFIIMLIYIFPVYAHFKVPYLRYVTLTLIIAVSFPVHTVGIIVGLFVLYYLFIYVPGLIPFVSVSLVAVFITWVALNAFYKMENLTNAS